MGGHYIIAGRKILNEYVSQHLSFRHSLTLATWTTFGLGAFAATRALSKKAGPTPPIVTSSSDEETFIKEFLQAAEAEEKNAH
ncbi:12711_t:CDS:2 [Ambispora gerdemannii]|uniref:12711_t:CDS:1 n=1 Tax=Ambispora gerdemannii TaxID=144530 RepID=A0A9N8WU38_9GLOM|nr:12711_t:CDS:2 [Ambispora gerdemannii]